MLAHLLIENYRCFEQAILEPGPLALLVGPNGAGKSTVFDALWNIRQLVFAGGSASELFPDSTRTRWGNQKIQQFELGFRGPDGDYTYRLAIRHGKSAQSGHIEREEILYEKRPLYTFSREEVTIHAHERSSGHRFPAGNKLSPLSNLPLQVRSTRLDQVTSRISHIWVFRPVPFEELSEGQRALVVLYTLLHAIPSQATLCIDEPEEFLSPREVQPWLNHLMEKTDEGGQAILISHNPGLIDLLAPSSGIFLAREHGGPAQVQSGPGEESGLPVSELLARGWLE